MFVKSQSDDSNMSVTYGFINLQGGDSSEVFCLFQACFFPERLRTAFGSWTLFLIRGAPAAEWILAARGCLRRHPGPGNLSAALICGTAAVVASYDHGALVVVVSGVAVSSLGLCCCHWQGFLPQSMRPESRWFPRPLLREQWVGGAGRTTQRMMDI